MSFIQDGPCLSNQYEEDHLLRSCLRRMLPKQMLVDIEPDLKQFGERVVTDILAMEQDAEDNEPYLRPFDAWGNRIDQVIVANGWKSMGQVTAEEGLVAIAYERHYGEFSRLYQLAKSHLFAPSSAVYTCPIAITDGVLRTIEILGDESLKKKICPHLMSRDPDSFWTSGLWMTERIGGSDVSQFETKALCDENGAYHLFGDKWFTSNITAQMTLCLARIEKSDGSQLSGSRGLSLFYLEPFDRDGKPNKIQIHRLKDKMGTRALPTAEITLAGTPAQLIGQANEGVKNVTTTCLNINRLYNAMGSAAAMRRGMSLMRDFSRRRQAFGQSLSNQVLHLETLAELEVEACGAFLLSFHAAALLGKEECGSATPDELAILRLLLPLSKLYNTKRGINFMSEVIESFGAQGYMEDTRIPKMLRDAQSLPIWEGSTNVLCLDALRALQKEGSLSLFLQDIHRRVASVEHPQLKASVLKVEQAIASIEKYISQAMSEGFDFIVAGARKFSFALARSFSASLLIEHANWSSCKENNSQYISIANRWCHQDLTPLIYPNAKHIAQSREMVLSE